MSPTSARPLAMLTREEDLPEWVDRVGAVPLRVERGTTDTARLRAAVRDAPSALIDVGKATALELARVVRGMDPALQIVIVSPGDAREHLRRSAVLAPGLGEVWVVTPSEVVPSLVRRAGWMTRQRRAYASAVQRPRGVTNRLGPALGPRGVVSDAYLAALLTVLPDPVISVDGAGTVLSWSPAAEDVLGVPPADALGKRAVDLLDPDEREALARVLAAEIPVEAEFRIRLRGEEGIVRIAVAPVEAEGEVVRAVFIHDRTESRRVRDALERQAHALEERAAALVASQRELEEANRELKAANERLAARTAEADQARAAAEESRRQAEAANRSKSDFLATMSHEIRTPINAVIGYTDLLEMGIGGPVTEAQRAQLGRIKTSSQHLLSLVQDVLDLARIEAGRMSFEARHVPVDETVSAALALVGPLAERRDIVVHDRCADRHDISYVGDDDRVRQILVNLLSNAIKFAGTGGRITLECGYEERAEGENGDDAPWTVIHIADDGIGIPPGELTRIFDAFEQVETGPTRARGGSGLGLTISRRLARMMGGDLTVESREGDGSTFTLWLPSEPTILAPLEGAVLKDLLGLEGTAHGIAPVGEALLAYGRETIDAYRERLGQDDAMPVAAGLGKADMVDHFPSLLADFGLALIAPERGESDAEGLLRDGGEIQRVIADLHGQQRARLGWSEEALRRDLAIQREEVERAASRYAPTGADVEGALRLLRPLIDRADRIATLAWRRARAGAPPASLGAGGPA